MAENDDTTPAPAPEPRVRADWLPSLIAGLGLLYDDILGLVNEAKSRFPMLAEALEYVAAHLKAKLGDKVKDVDALAALLYAQITAGGSDPDSGSDV